jgi:hypothetical protein
MHNTRISPFFRLTAAGLTLSLVGLTFAPLAHAQGATAPAKPAPAPAAAPAKPAQAPADPSAAAPKPPDKKTRDAARKAYSGAEKSFAAGDYAAAQTGFEQANILIPAPQAEYWIAKSLEAQPDKGQDAVAAYERFLANPDAAKAGEDKVADAKTRLEELKAKLVAQIDLITLPSGATVLVDGNPQPGATPLTLKLSPGPHKLSISAPEYETKEIELDVKGGEKMEQKVELAAKPPPQPEPAPIVAPPPAPMPPPAPPPEPRSLVPAFVTLGIATAGVVVGTVFGLQALSAKSDFEDNPTTDAADDTERNALIADMAFGVAITLGVTGIVLLTSGDDAPREAARATPPRYKLELDAHGNKTGGGANARLSF